MGWTLDEYRRAPACFINEVWMFLQTEARVEADVMKEQLERGR